MGRRSVLRSKIGQDLGGEFWYNALSVGVKSGSLVLRKPNQSEIESKSKAKSKADSLPKYNL